MLFREYTFECISNSIVFLVWIVMFFEFTKTNISNNHKLLQPSFLFVACHTHMMTLPGYSQGYSLNAPNPN